jgi:hypothetical protein
MLILHVFHETHKPELSFFSIFLAAHQVGLPWQRTSLNEGHLGAAFDWSIDYL